MAFSFLKPKPKPAPVRQRPSGPSMPQVMVGHLGAERSSSGGFPTLDDEASKQQMYKKLRRAPTATELRVSDLAMAWLISLPKELRPVQCCQAYPHVVNHLAGWWDGPEALESYFDDLLRSTRKQRAGFPPPIKAELEALYRHARSQGLLATV